MHKAMLFIIVLIINNQSNHYFNLLAASACGHVAVKSIDAIYASRRGGFELLLVQAFKHANDYNSTSQLLLDIAACCACCACRASVKFLLCTLLHYWCSAICKLNTACSFNVSMTRLQPL